MFASQVKKRKKRRKNDEKIKEKQEQEIQKYLRSFQALSVRELEGVRRVEEMTGKEAERLIDPAFLLTKEEWSRVAVSPQKQRKIHTFIYYAAG